MAIWAAVQYNSPSLSVILLSAISITLNTVVQKY